MEAQEKVFYQDTYVTVTQARFISQGKTYAMNNISSVYSYKLPRKLGLPIMLIVLGLALVYFPMLSMIGWPSVIIGVIMLILRKQKYSVRIQSNSGETDGFISKDKQYVDVIVRCINDAIVHRG